MMVSVIIPCFNRGKIVLRAIESVLLQDFQDYEIIVVDDASDDVADLRRMLDAFDDTRIRLICHEKNQGGGAARNTGVEHARGDLIAFLDSDDEWNVQKLAKQVKLAVLQADGNWLIYSQSHVLTTQKYGVQQSVMPLKAIDVDLQVGDYLFTNGGWLPTPSMLLPRELAKRVPFNPKLRRHQDYDLLLRLEKESCRFLMIEEPLVIVHWEDLHQTSRGLNPERSLYFLDEYGSMMSPKARSGFVYSQIVGGLLREGRKFEALTIALKYIRPWHLSLSTLVGAFSLLLFRDARLAVLGSRLKKAAGMN